MPALDLSTVGSLGASRAGGGARAKAYRTAYRLENGGWARRGPTLWPIRCTSYATSIPLVRQIMRSIHVKSGGNYLPQLKIALRTLSYRNSNLYICTPRAKIEECEYQLRRFSRAVTDDEPYNDILRTARRL